VALAKRVFEFRNVTKGQDILLALFFIQVLVADARLSPASAGTAVATKHFAGHLIPMLLCEEPVICCGAVLSLGAATRYELGALKKPGNDHE
jgi:hypothetical protein